MFDTDFHIANVSSRKVIGQKSKDSYRRKCIAAIVRKTKFESKCPTIKD